MNLNKFLILLAASLPTVFILSTELETKSLLPLTWPERYPPAIFSFPDSLLDIAENLSQTPPSPILIYKFLT